MADRELKVQDEISALTQVIFITATERKLEHFPIVATTGHAHAKIMCVCVLVCTHVHQGALMCGGYRSTLKVFLSFPPPYFLS